jgi:hypothetical protein
MFLFLKPLIDPWFGLFYTFTKSKLGKENAENKSNCFRDSQGKYLFKLSAFHECGSSSPVWSSRRKAPGMFVSLAMYGPSHGS